MGKTEAAILESIRKKGYYVGQGRRAFTVAKRMSERGALAGMDVTFDAFNGNANRSQWNHPKIIKCYEVSIRKVA